MTTASVDNLRFLRGAYQRDVIVIIGKVTYVGNTSMEVKVDSYVEDIDGVKTPINHAFFTMVALDDNDKPTPVPRLELETEEEQEEWEKAREAQRSADDAQGRKDSRIVDGVKAISTVFCTF